MAEEVITTAVIKVGPEHDPAVLALAEEAKKIRDFAMARVIAARADLKPATEDLSLIAKLRKALGEKKADYLKPIKAHIDAMNVAFTSIMAPLDEADKITRSKVNEYQAAVKKRQLEAEEINRQKQELAQKEAAFNGTGEITADTTPVEAPAPVKHVYTDVGSIGTTTIWKFEVVDFALLPDQYKMADEVKIGKVVRATKGTVAIPGVKMWPESSIRVTTTR